MPEHDFRPTEKTAGMNFSVGLLLLNSSVQMAGNVQRYVLYRIVMLVQVCLHSKLVITSNVQRVKETDCDGTDIHELTLEAFMCIEGDKRQALEIFGKRFVPILTHL